MIEIPSSENEGVGIRPNQVQKELSFRCQISTLIAIMVIFCALTAEETFSMMKSIFVGQKYQQIKKNIDIPYISIQELIKQYPNMDLQIHNLHNANVSDFQKHTVKIQKLVNPTDIVPNTSYSYQQLGAYQRIQVGSILDYSDMLSPTIIQRLEKQVIQDISHQVLSFKFNETLDKEKKFITFDNQGQYELLKQVASKMNINDQYFFSVRLAENPEDSQLQKLQYLYYDKKYNIGSIKEEQPICVFGTGYKLYSNNRYRLFFEALTRQNYTNFQIVYVDDNSPDQSAYHIFKYIASLNSNLKNRLKIVHNLQHLGTTGNIYFWIKKYCQKDSIVINIDADDSIIGSQVLRILNSIYQNPDIWYAYSKYIVHQPQINKYISGCCSQYFFTNPYEYRKSQNIWITSHARTFRKQLMDSTPFYHYAQFILKKESKNQVYPSFYTSSADRYQIYSHIQLSGKQHLRHFSDYIYLYDSTIGVSTRKCYRSHQMVQQYKSRVKTPLGPLKSIKQMGKPIKNLTIIKFNEKYLLQKLKYYRNQYKNCLQQNNMTEQ